MKALESNTFWLAENPDSVGMMGWDAVCVRIATWSKFKEKATGKDIHGCQAPILTMWVKRPAVKAHCSLSVR